MPLCELLLATDAELSSLAESGSPGDGLTRVDAKGFDVLPIEALAKRLGVGRAPADGKPDIHSDDFEWFVHASHRHGGGAREPVRRGLRRACHALTEAGVTDWDPSDLRACCVSCRPWHAAPQPEGRGCSCGSPPEGGAQPPLMTAPSLSTTSTPTSMPRRTLWVTTQKSSNCASTRSMCGMLAAALPSVRRTCMWVMR
jgi:hypothetical protein